MGSKHRTKQNNQPALFLAIRAKLALYFYSSSSNTSTVSRGLPLSSSISRNIEVVAPFGCGATSCFHDELPKMSCYEYAFVSLVFVLFTNLCWDQLWREEMVPHPQSDF